MPSAFTEIKICGVTKAEQATAIAESGAHYIGCVIDFPLSLRSISAERAREIREAIDSCRQNSYSTRTVGVVVNMPLRQLKQYIHETGITIWQLHGNENEEYIRAIKNDGVEVWKAVSPENYREYPNIADKLLVDSPHSVHGAGGSGNLSDWAFARNLVDSGYRVVLSGGLDPANVAVAAAQVRPDIVDVSSRIEASPGIKDLRKVEKLINNVREYEQYFFQNKF